MPSRHSRTRSRRSARRLCRSARVRSWATSRGYSAIDGGFVMNNDARHWREERDHAERRKSNGGSPPSARFKLIDWNDIAFDAREQWLIEDVLPLRGLGLVFGKQGSFKSFVAMGLALAVMLGEPWAGKGVEKGNILYLAAEGGPGMAKRIAPHKAKHKIPRGQFALVSTTPNLGAGEGDLPALIA